MHSLVLVVSTSRELQIPHWEPLRVPMLSDPITASPKMMDSRSLRTDSTSSVATDEDDFSLVTTQPHAPTSQAETGDRSTAIQDLFTSTIYASGSLTSSPNNTTSSARSLPERRMHVTLSSHSNRPQSSPRSNSFFSVSTLPRIPESQVMEAAQDELLPFIAPPPLSLPPSRILSPLEMPRMVLGGIASSPPYENTMFETPVSRGNFMIIRVAENPNRYSAVRRTARRRTSWI